MIPKTPVTTRHNGDEPHQHPANPGQDVPVAPAFSGQSVVIQALLDEMSNAKDAWGFLNTLRNDENMSMETRHSYYSKFIGALVAKPPAERDALINAGQSVFKYRAETVRRDLLALDATNGGTKRVATTVVREDFIADLVHVPGQGVRYLVYRNDGSTEIASGLDLDGISYTPPPIDDLVRANTLVLPTGVEPYGATGDLFRAVRGFLTSYSFLNDRRFSNFATSYIFYTHVADRLPIAPYLVGVGDYGAGKTRFLSIMRKLVRSGLSIAGCLTPAVLFRVLTLCPLATACTDESDFDTRSDLWTTIRTVLNLGSDAEHSILRLDKKTNEQFTVGTYTSFGPKIFMVRRPLPDAALASRCWTHVFRPMAIPEHIPLILGAECDQQAAVLRNKLFLWRLQHYQTIAMNTTERIEGIEPRVNAIVLPLLSICTDGLSPLRKEIIEAAREHSEALRTSRAESWEGIVAQALIERWRNRRPGETEVLLKLVTDRVQQDHPTITPEKVSAIVRGPLGFKTHRKGGGYSWAVTSEAEIKALAVRYGVQITPRTPVASTYRTTPP